MTVIVIKLKKNHIDVEDKSGLYWGQRTKCGGGSQLNPKKLTIEIDYTVLRPEATGVNCAEMTDCSWTRYAAMALVNRRDVDLRCCSSARKRARKTTRVIQTARPLTMSTDVIVAAAITIRARGWGAIFTKNKRKKYCRRKEGKRPGARYDDGAGWRAVRRGI